MVSRADISTIELSRTRLALRDDLKFTPQCYAGRAWCHVERTSTGQYFRLGWPEYVFVSLLNGRSTFAEVLAMSSRISGAASLSMQAATDLNLWLLKNHFATVVGVPQSSGRETGGPADGGRRSFGISRFNPLWIRIPLGRPERILRALQPVFGWLLSAGGMWTGLVLAIAALAVLSGCWSEFAASASTLMSGDNWLKLLLCGIGLKLFHELGHGLACLRYGGTVREAGVVFALLAPLPYVDASSAWGFRSRWKRLHTALAGVQFELMIAAIAMTSWPLVSDPVTKQLLQNVVVMASFTTVIFNLNPLMRFDGYFVATDLTQIPNLQSESSAAFKSLLLRVLLGEQQPHVRGGRWGLLISFAAASWLWRAVMVFALLAGSAALFRGAGILLTAAGVMMWFGSPVLRILQATGRLWQNAPERLLRAVLVAAAAGACTWCVLWHLPVPLRISAPGVLEYSRTESVRVLTPGFVRAIPVRDGDWVKAGDPLVVLKNDEVENSISLLQRRISGERLKLHAARGSHDGVLISIAEGNLTALEQELAAQRSRLDALVLRAVEEGVVVFPDDRSQEGRWLPEGTQVMTIVQPEQKEVRFSIAQRDLPLTMALCGQPVRVHIPHVGTFEGRLEEIDPRASRQLFSDALFAANGGPLPTRFRAKDSTGADRELELPDLRFVGKVVLPRSDGLPPGTGQRASVSLGRSREPLGGYLWRSIKEKIRELIARREPAQQARSGL